MIGANLDAVPSHPGAGDHIRCIVAVCQRYQLSIPQTAYVLATAQHESRMGLVLVDQSSGWGYENRDDLGNVEHGDGPRYRPRGYVRIVGRNAYSRWADEIGEPLVARPEMVAEPKVAAEILVRAMKYGRCTGHSLDEYINESTCDYVGARRIVKGQDLAGLVATYARRFEAALRLGRGSESSKMTRSEIRQVQRLLRMIGWPLVVDGFYGTYTRRAVHDFQTGYALAELPATGDLDSATLGALSHCANAGGYASPRFRFTDFRTGGQLRLSVTNHVILVERTLLLALERLADEAGTTPVVTSGYRSAAYNSLLNGAPDSDHLAGCAVDLAHPHLPVNDVLDLGLFSSIGTQDDLAVHLAVQVDDQPVRPRVFRLD